MALAILTLPFPPIQPSRCPSPDSTSLTPRSSFYTTSYCTVPESSTRPNSCCSIDSGYASTVGPQTNSMPFGKKRLSPSNADVYVCSSGELPKPKKALFLQRRKKSPDDTSFPRTSWHTHKDDIGLSSADEEDDEGDNIQGMHSPASAFKAKHHFTTRRGMIHHPYPPDQVPYMQAYDRTLLDK